ncbi:MAG: cytochrome c [candidate division NC10 bacterium]|nr:cytochrome c [candidate division NC10 bacterium]
MDRRVVFPRILIVCGLVLVGTAGCATMQGGMVSQDPVADRQRLMRLNGASWADIQAKVKAGNIDGVAVNAETIAINAMHIPALFPEGSLTPKSNAKPEIWQKWDDFTKAAKNFETLAANLRDRSRAKDKAGVEAAVKEFGAKACGTCHTPFRVPPPPPPKK